MDITTWLVEPKYTIGSTVYTKDNNAVYKMRITSIQPIIQEHPDKKVKLTIRYYIRGVGDYSAVPGKLVEENILFATSEEAFK